VSNYSNRHTRICFPIAGCLTTSAKDCTGIARTICSRKDGTPVACNGDGALRKCDGSRGRRGLNEKENWRRAGLGRRNVVRRQYANQLIELLQVRHLRDEYATLSFINYVTKIPSRESQPLLFLFHFRHHFPLPFCTFYWRRLFLMAHLTIREGHTC
jgi:hypothetical protein